jgi:hypothetical protein
MKKLSTLIIFILGFFVFTSGITSSQTKDTTKIATLNKPFIIIDVNGGIDIPLLDLKGNSPMELYEFTNYGVSMGPATSINVKMAILTKRMAQLRLYSTLGYAHFAQSGNNAYGIDVVNTLNYPAPGYGWPNYYNGQYRHPVLDTGNSFARINNFYFSFGCEYAQYTDVAAKSSFCFGLDLDLSLITGRVYENPDITFPAQTFNTIEPTLRLGFGGNIVWNYRFNNVLGLNIGGRFMWANLIGKTSKETTEAGWMALNDKADASLNPYLANSRNIAFVKLFAGLSFYIGKR